MVGGTNTGTDDTIAFGPFTLNAAERLLLRGNEPIVIGSRALDILIALTEQSGKVVSRRELIERAWPNLVVAEANLRVHIGILRKALGDGQSGARYVTNVPGRGYCFVARIQRLEAAPAPSVPGVKSTLSASPHTLPAKLARIVGRDETVTALSALLISRRFVSVVGPGGMGKTTVAISVAHALLEEFSNAVFFVDLGAVTNATLVPMTVASAVDFLSQTQDPLPALLTFLAGRRALIVLDNCEHLIDAVAGLTESLFFNAPQVHILTTSREPLRAEGEYVHLLQPLESPPLDLEVTATQALTSSAVQLFMERAAAGGYRFELSDRDAPVVASICHQLDGIALAIELAAGRVGTYGIRGTVDLLNNRFKLLWQGRRSAVPRHQTLYAMLDWSYNLLSKRDRQVLRRLAIFIGIFTLDAAQDVTVDADVSAMEAAEALTSLIDKSLIWTSTFEGMIYYRLLDTTRAYAASKLAESGERDMVARRHACHYYRYLKTFGPEAICMSDFSGRDLPSCSAQIGSIRAALEWSFSDRGDSVIGVDLAVRSAPLFLGLSLLGECQRWCAQGLAVMNGTERGTRKELALQEARAISAMFGQGNSEAVLIAINRGLDLAEALGELPRQLHLLAGLHSFLIRTGDFHGAVAVGQRSAAVAEEVGTSGAMVMADWMLGCAYHLVGNQERAQTHCELGLKRATAIGPVHVDFFGFDHRVRALLVFARTLWLSGFPDRAARTARHAIEEAERRNHPINLCLSLIYTVTIYLWCGSFAEAEELIARLLEHATKHSLGPYYAVGRGLKGELAVARGQAEVGVELLRSSLAVLRAERHQVLTTAFSRALAEGLAQCGQTREAAATIADSLAWEEKSGDTYETPNLWRARAEILLASPQPATIAAEEALLRSLEYARNQFALSWELRAAIALARLWLSQACHGEAKEMLTRIYRRFTEGFESADLKVAGQLLEQLGSLTSALPTALTSR